VRPRAPTADGDSFETRLSLVGEAAVPLLSAPPTETPVPVIVQQRRTLPWLAIGGAAVLLILTGVVLGARTREEQTMTRLASEQRDRSKPEVAGAVVAAATALPAVHELPTEPPGAPGSEPAAQSEEPASAPSSPGVAPISSLLTAPSRPPEGSSAAAASLPVRAPGSAASTEELPGFDASAASAALTSAFERAQSCRQPTDPSGAAIATITYAPSGRVTTALVSGDFAGTPIGGCIAGHLRSAKVPAFAGDYTTVRRSAVFR
jgi:hypothetical protein